MAKVNLGKDSSGRPLVVDDRTLAKLRAAEKALGHRFTIVQGSWRGGSGAAASAGTHDRGGVIDLRTWNLPTGVTPQEAVTALRRAGLIAWYRTRAQGFDPHIHAIDYGNPDLAPSAARQVTAWKNGRNGLASNGPDDGPRVTIPKAPPSAPALPRKGLRIDGVDLSHHNKVTGSGLDAAKKAGVRWVYHKATEGTTFTDRTYTARRTLCAERGIPFGAYHFARPDRDGKDAVAEARKFLDVAGVRPGDMRPMLDLEDRGGLTRAQLTDWVGAFVIEVKRQAGVLPLIYTPFDLDETFGCMLWVARYHPANEAPRIPAPWKRYRIRQFSNGQIGNPATVVGLGAVDLNTMPHDNPSDLDWFKVPMDKPKPAKPKPAPKVTRTLRLGLWNLERDRKPAIVLAELTRWLGKATPDVVMLSECNDYKTILGQVPGYQRVAFYDIREQAEAMMLVRDGLSVTDARAVQVTFDPDGAGPKLAGWWTGKTSKTPAKHVTVATVEGCTLVSYHPAPSAEFASKRVLFPNRWRSYRESQAKVAALAQTITGPLVIGADWNWNANRDDGTNPHSPAALAKVLEMVRAFPKGGTHGSRAIDGFLVRGGEVLAVQVWDGDGSDHKKVTATLTYTP